MILHKGWKEISKFLDANISTIKHAIKRKQLPVKYPCGRPQLSEDEYIKWLEKQPPGITK